MSTKKSLKKKPIKFAPVLFLTGVFIIMLTIIIVAFGTNLALGALVTGMYLIIFAYLAEE